jgi:hypothetical protein
LLTAQQGILGKSFQLLKQPWWSDSPDSLRSKQREAATAAATAAETHLECDPYWCDTSLLARLSNSLAGVAETPSCVSCWRGSVVVTQLLLQTVGAVY